MVSTTIPGSSIPWETIPTWQLWVYQPIRFTNHTYFDNPTRSHEEFHSYFFDWFDNSGFINHPESWLLSLWVNHWLTSVNDQQLKHSGNLGHASQREPLLTISLDEMDSTRPRIKFKKLSSEVCLAMSGQPLKATDVVGDGQRWSFAHCCLVVHVVTKHDDNSLLLGDSHAHITDSSDHDLNLLLRNHWDLANKLWGYNYQQIY